MHVQPSCRFADVSVTEFIDPLDVLPAHAVRTHRVRGRRRHFIVWCQQGGGHIIGVSGFGEIVGRTDLYSGHRRGNGAVSRQDHDAAVRPALTNAFDHVEAVAIFEPQIHDRIGRRSGRRNRTAGGNGIRCLHGETALFHCARQPLQKRLVVIHNQK